MIDQLEALAALSRTGTMTAAAQRLRISQSAISKRVASLEARLGRDLVRRHGRGVTITADGAALLKRVEPLLVELRTALAEPAPEQPVHLRIGCSESLLTSWGAPTLSRALACSPDLTGELHAHRSPEVRARVRRGDYSLGLCAGLRRATGELRSIHLAEEPMVVVPAGLGPLRLGRRKKLEVLTIEPGSATWRSFSARARELGLRPLHTVENFACAAHMARNGFGHGLVPLGVARSLGIPEKHLLRLPKGGMTRPVILVGRKTTLGDPRVAALATALREEVAEEATAW